MFENVTRLPSCAWSLLILIAEDLGHPDVNVSGMRMVLPGARNWSTPSQPARAKWLSGPLSTTQRWLTGSASTVLLRQGWCARAGRRR